MAVLRNGSKCSHTTCAVCSAFSTASRLALNPNLIFEIGSIIYKEQEDREIDSNAKQNL